jgi:hypothetical protein
MPPNAPAKQVIRIKIGTAIVQLESVARKLIISNRIEYMNPFAIPKYQPFLPERLADTNPPANAEYPCTPKTHGIMFDSLREEPMSKTDRTKAPMASHIPDQYKPEATGDALRSPNKRENELKENHSFFILVCISLWRCFAS